MKLKGKVALVAGGGQGIGEGISLCFAEEGADVAIADINADNAKKVAKKVEAMGRKALALSADLTEEDEAQKIVQETVDFFGRIDILINNVGGVNAETLMQVGEHRADPRACKPPRIHEFQYKSLGSILPIEPENPCDSKPGGNPPFYQTAKRQDREYILCLRKAP